MRTKLAFTLTALLLTTHSFAASTLFSGFYASISSGWMNSDVTDKQTFTVNSVNIANQTDITEIDNRIYTSTSREDRNGVTGGLNFGYAYSIYEKYVVAMEARANLQKLKINFDNGRVSYNLSNVDPDEVNFNNQIKLNNDFAFLLKFGINPSFLQNVLLYTLIGPSWGNFKVSEAFAFSSSLQNITQNDAYSLYATGILVGLGVEYKFYKNLGLAFEFSHTDYGKLSEDSLNQSLITGINENTDLNTSITVNNKVYAKTNNFTCKINYYF